jgi:ribosome biogenesis protein MAK21
VEHPNDPRKYVLDALLDHATSLLAAENELASKTLFSDSSHKFMTQIMTTGTLEDKVSAYTLSIQESPLHTIKAFEHLLGMSRKKSRNHAIMALAALKDLLSQGVVLPADRKLRYFAKQPGLVACLQDTKTWRIGEELPRGIQEIHLLSWAYEDWLKKTYFEMIKILEGWCNDEIEFTRTRALGFIYELLKEKPEQEENLLRLIVNKMGDKTKRVASRSSYLLLQLEQAHPNMKETVTKAIEADVLFRPGQSLSAKYYAIITLNQTVLSSKEQELARTLLDIYFGAFKTLLLKDSAQKKAAAKAAPGQKLNRKALKRLKDEEEALQAEEELREKLVAQILTGVNRAFPFADTTSSSFEAQLDTLYRITHSSNFNTGIQALILIQMITQAKGVITDRYYRTLYESVLDPRLVTSTKQVMYLNLLYKSLKTDLSGKRVQAFVKRLIQSLSIHDAPFICSALYLINELGNTFPNVATMLTTPELEDEDEEEHFVDVPEDGEPAKNGGKPSTARAHDTSYDARKRDPLHANADRSCLWELLPFQAHFHPSVALFASKILTGEKMPPKPDPTLHTLMHFLDRFVYRNAKSKTALRGSSIMQPLAGNEAVDLLIKDRSGASKENPLNTEAFWNQKIENVPVDEVFFHQYFAQANKKKSKKEKKRKTTEDDESIAADDSDAGEDEIWKALVDSRPEIEGDEDEGGFSDMEDLMEGDDDDDDDLEDMVEDMEIDEAEDGSSDGEVELNLDSDSEDMADESADGGVPLEDDDGGDLTLADLESDEDALYGSDDDLPSEIEDAAADAAAKKKGDKAKKRKLKNLPIFASAEDYAKLIGDSDEE